MNGMIIFGLYFSDYTISYLARDTEGQAVYLSMLSDWDMDAAFQCAADPCLKLKVDLRPFEEGLDHILNPKKRMKKRNQSQSTVIFLY